MWPAPDGQRLLAQLSSLPVDTYLPGSLVLAAGSSTGKLLVLREGAVEVVIDGERIAEVSEPGAVFGELALLLSQPHGADVRTLRPTTFHVADGASYLRAAPGAALYLATVLARRVAAVDRHLVEARRRLTSAPAGRVIDEMMDNIAEAVRFGPPL